jgi:hypothetical protein
VPQGDDELEMIPASVWGTDAAYSWSYPPPPAASFDGRHVLQLTIRQTEQPLPPAGEGVVLRSQSKAVPMTNAKLEFGAGGALLSPGLALAQSRTASVQLLDLRDIGATSARVGQTLRVLANVKFGGTSDSLNGSDIFLPAGHFAGTSWQQRGRWTGSELYL